MIKGRILGVDYGERRVGVAVTDPMQIIVSWLETLTVTNDREAANRLAKLVQEQEAVAVVVGLPLAMSGSDSDKTRQVREFIKVLEEKVTVPVITWDERLSSVSAQRMLLESEEKKKRRTKEKIDSLAAAVILRHYMDSKEASR